MTSAKMNAIIQQKPGGAETLEWGHANVPQPASSEVLIRVHATAFNPADVGSREGRYLSEGQQPTILGLECAGIVESVGDKVTQWQVGDRVCALLTHGGYAQYVAVHEGMVLPVPDSMSFSDATALPESLCTVWSNFAMTPNPLAARSVLIHGGSGSVGTIAIQMAKVRGDLVFTTVGSAAGADIARQLGADHVINYRTEDFVEVVRAETGGFGVNQIVDIIGAPYFERNVEALSLDGHLAVISVQGGANIEANLFKLMQKRLTLTATMLKSRPESDPAAIEPTKVEIVAGVRDNFWPAVEEGKITPIVGAVLPLSEARTVHEQHRDNALAVGKTVFQVD